MASYTGNLNLKKPALDDDALITDINNNMDILDAAVNGIQDGLAIVANGNTHVAITSGQFVYVRNHGTLTEGLYVASTNIAANATLSSSNLTADAAGGLNALNSNIAQLGKYVAGTKNAVNCPNGGVATTIGTITLNKGRWIIFVNGWSPLGDVQEHATLIYISGTFGCATIPFRLFSMSGLIHINSDNTVLDLKVTNWESEAKTSGTAYNFYATRVGF